MTQQIAAHYTQSSADSIRYFDANGDGYETSEALKRDLVKRSQVCVVYKDGTTVVANGSKTEGMTAKLGDRVVELPPNGYAAWTADGKVLVESFLYDAQRRFDYSESPEYVWFDARGTWVERKLACGNGAGVCRFLETPGEYEVIPYDDGELGFRVAQARDSVTAVALDHDNNELGAASVRRSRGFVFIDRVDGAFSYKLVVKPAEDGAKAEEWTASKLVVAPGDRVVFTKGDESVEWTAPQSPDDAGSAGFVSEPFGLSGETYWLAAADPVRHVWTEPVPGEFADAFVAEPASYAFRTDGDGRLDS